MCGRLSQYDGIHDFVAALSMPNALVNKTGDQPIERYNAAPTTQLAIFHQEGQYLHADMVRWGWRPNWAKDRSSDQRPSRESGTRPILPRDLAAPSNHRDQQLV
jgi:putative SOS response-associated peptidase YedK